MRIRRIKSSCLVLLPTEGRFIAIQLQLLCVHSKRGHKSQTFRTPVIRGVELLKRCTDLQLVDGIGELSKGTAVTVLCDNIGESWHFKEESR